MALLNERRKGSKITSTSKAEREGRVMIGLNQKSSGY